MTSIILFHASRYRDFKSYYTGHVLKHLAWAFPRLVSYNRFVEWMSAALVPLYGRPPTRAGVEGYVSQPLFETLDAEGVQLVTKLKRGMKNRLMPVLDKIMLRKRAIIESVVDQLKNISQVEHSRHRSAANCFVNLVAGLAAYSWREKKPSLNIRVKEQLRLPALVF